MNLINLRKENKLTQEDIGKILNITSTGYANYENGKREPTIETLIKLADYYNVSLDYLVGRQFGNGIGYITEEQKTFINVFLALEQHNQLKLSTYALTLLAGQQK